VPYSLSFQLAYQFLHKAGIQPLQVTPNQQWQFGSVVFHPLSTRFVGYQTLESVNQIMLNYRTAPPGQKTSLQRALNGQITAEMVRDRIVLIGYTAPVARDSFMTPYGKMAGVWIHAHMVSQLLSSALEKRSLIWGLPQWGIVQSGDILWVAIWSFGTTIIVRWLQSRPLLLGVAIVLLVGCIFQLCSNVLNQGGWLPFIPTLLAVAVAAIGTVLYSRFNRR
jgi:CHASE2 domain-containing sensor protein